MDQADGGLSISFDDGTVELQGDSILSNVFSIKLQKKSISLESLEALRRERNINMDHSFIKQLRRTDIELYVVTEILESSEEAEYKESTKAGRGFMAKCYARASAQSTREDKQSIVIPKGCTLAFRTIQIHIRDGAWDASYFQREDYITASYEGPSLGKLGVVVREDEKHCQIFSEFSLDLPLIILTTIKAVMRDKNLLQELRQKMEEVAEQNDGYELKTESPDLQALFSTLQHSPRDRLLQLAEGITYVLDALHELMEDQLLLLLESLERKIVPKQLKLVRTHITFGSLQGEEEDRRLTIALVELSRVVLQGDGAAVPRDQPFEAVAALFVALYTLNILSGSN
ncbi:LOW QUALITY PROTEIN: gasdermin-A3-like [Sylvia atricapilla]|uniref:LOW QUALITY PROTEIN: gasdermin-A3-like n=1 Tax=Sylvia atricapilla TaxID=48155 RepID=UPI003397CC12